jgi:hypothetical protein
LLVRKEPQVDIHLRSKFPQVDSQGSSSEEKG